MKRKNLIIFLLIVFITLSFTHPPYSLVKFVYDGDTILIDTGEKVRYLGIDAPEIGREGKKSEYMAFESRDLNLRLIHQCRVKLEFDQGKRDSHGRLLAYVYVENGDMINALLVRRGLAYVMIKRPNLKYVKLLLEYQRLAMTEKLGIWRKEPVKQEKCYMGNRKSYRFHRPTCPFAAKILSHNLVRLKTRHDAFWEGFGPCKQYRP